jgi:glycosyltransferase involved in cell wall biosynthesis
VRLFTLLASKGKSVSRPEAIVLLVPGFPGSEAETNCLPPVQNFVKALSERNPSIAVHVFSFQYPFEPGIYTWHGATVHAFAGRNKKFPIRFGTWLQLGVGVWRLTRSHRVIAIHSMWLAECTFVASLLARTCVSKLIASIQGQDALSGNPYLKRIPFDGMVVTAGSKKAAEAFQESTGRRVDHIIPIGLDREAMTHCRSAHDRTIDILGVGSLSPIKDFGSFLEIVYRVYMDYPGLQCRVIGDGPERAQLDAYINEHKLQTAVCMAGRLSREEVLDTMNRSKILLHTSKYEGQGYVFLEALASGMHVVCRDVGYTGPGDGVYRCKTNENMIDVLKTLLASSLDPSEVDVIGIDDTAKAFEEMYGLTRGPSPLKDIV